MEIANEIEKLCRKLGKTSDPNDRREIEVEIERLYGLLDEGV